MRGHFRPPPCWCRWVELEFSLLGRVVVHNDAVGTALRLHPISYAGRRDMLSLVRALIAEQGLPSTASLLEPPPIASCPN